MREPIMHEESVEPVGIATIAGGSRRFRTWEDWVGCFGWDGLNGNPSVFVLQDGFRRGVGVIAVA